MTYTILHIELCLTKNYFTQKIVKILSLKKTGELLGQGKNKFDEMIMTAKKRN